MKLNAKESILILATAMLVTPLLTNAQPTIYGKFNLALEHIDKEATTAEPNNVDAWEVKSHASRFGVKGDMDTDAESLDVIYMLEWEIDVTDEKDAEDNHIKARNQYVGLKGNFGEFILGRHDTPLKASQGKLDLFGDMDADIKALMASGEVRSDNIWQYTSPKFADTVTVTLMGIPGEENERATPGADVNNGIADATSLSVAFDNDMLHLAIATDSGVAGNDIDTLRLVGTVKLGNFGVGAMIQTTDYAGGLLIPDPMVDEEEVSVLSAYYQ